MMPSVAYSIIVEPILAEDGGGFLASVPDLPGCKSDGETEAEALKNAREAITDWLAHATVEGRKLSKPNRPRFYNT